MRVTNSILYCTIKGILKKLSWNVLFAFSYLQMLSYTTPFITCFILATHYMSKIGSRYGSWSRHFNVISDYTMSVLRGQYFRERILEQQRANYRANKARLLEYKRQYYASHREQIRERRRLHRQTHLERIRESSRRY